MRCPKDDTWDAAVKAALIPSRQKLADLEVQIAPIVEEPEELPTYRRKLVKLQNSDMVGSIQMTQHLDPEDPLEFMDNVLPRLVASVDSHGGHVARNSGDGFKAVFGDPIAREKLPEL